MNPGSATYWLGFEILIKLPNVKGDQSHSRLRESKKAKIGNCLALMEDSKWFNLVGVKKTWNRLLWNKHENISR